jgi:hypothetical protein
MPVTCGSRSGRVVAMSWVAPLLLLLAGCGSTVQLSGTRAGSGAGDGGLSTGTVGVPDGEVGAGSGGPIGSTGSGGSGSGGSGSGGSGSGLGGGSGLPSPGVSSEHAVAARGVTATTIKIGIPYTKFNGAAFGAAGVDSGDQKGFAEAVIADINRRGGVLGRKLVPVWFETPGPGSGSDPAQGYQAACTRFTQDSPVFIAIGTLPSDNYRACLQKAGVPLLNEGFTALDKQGFDRFRSSVDINGFDLDRAAAALVRSLADQRWFTGWNTTLGSPATTPAKVGVISVDLPEFRAAVSKVLEPALARAGYPAVRTVFANPNPGGNGPATVQNAILDFRSAGVTHVLIYDYSAGVTTYWMTEARSQNYLPRYGLNTQNGIGILAQAGVIDGSQLAGALGMGWEPIIDLKTADDPDTGPYSNSARRYCLSVLGKAGITYSGDNAKAFALEFCDLLYFADHIIERGGPSNLTNTGFVSTVVNSGASFVAAITPRTFFSANRRDGVGGYYRFAYDTSCRCMRYTGSLRSL